MTSRVHAIHVAPGRRLPTTSVDSVEAEAGTRPWLTLRAEQDPTVFYLVDLFDDEDARNVHLNGAAAELILGTGGALLAEQPTPVPTTLVAGKAV